MRKQHLVTIIILSIVSLTILGISPVIAGDGKFNILGIFALKDSDTGLVPDPNHCASAQSLIRELCDQWKKQILALPHRCLQS